jgi:diguanylate cyclase (GGDEF)-like protein
VASALAGLAACVLIVDSDGGIVFANGRTEALFAPLRPTDFRLAALLALSGASGGGELMSAINVGSTGRPFRIGLPDGRILDSQICRLPNACYVVTLFDVTSYVKEAELATRDTLTGLANRKAFQQRLIELFAQLERKGPPFAVVSLDLDRFKNVNDTFGHPTGDALLVMVAERLRNTMRVGDLVARLGGDEFAILQSDVAQPQSGEALASRCVDLVSRTYLIGDHVLDVGASVGVALAPADGLDPATLMKNADLALYRAKADGRGNFRFFQPAMDAEMQARRTMEVALRRALALKEFELVYQPQIDLASDTLAGFEALLRWRNPERGLVSPAHFIPLAEEIGLISQIGDWVLRAACREAASWARPVSVAVNISASQFEADKLVATVKSALEASGLQAARLELEITEGALLDHTDTVLRQLRAIKAFGVKISMDDFGTGYSSLSYLHKFPFDKIKIDQSFVRGSDSSTECAAIVRAVAALGASLGMKTTAEGVESSEQLARIRAKGCSQVQGYLTGRPLSAQAAGVLASEPPNPQPARESADVGFVSTGLLQP